MDALAEIAPALLQAAALAARSALLGGAAFLLAISSPVARRLPAGQAALLMARTQFFLRLAALATILLGALQFAGGQFAALGVMLAAGAVLLISPREGPSPRLAWVILALSAVAMILAVSGGRLSMPELATLLREAGAALWMGNLPLLWMLLRAPWPAAVPQAIGLRHAWLMALGMGLACGGLALAWPYRTLLFGEAPFPLLAITVGFIILAQIAAMLRVALLIEAGRAAPAKSWLPRLGFVVEAELLLAIVLCGPIVAIFVLAAQGLTPEAAPDWGALIPDFALHAFGAVEATGLVLLLIALLAWLHRAGGLPIARFGPALLAPLGALLALDAEGLGLALALMILLAGLAEAWVAWRGQDHGVAMVLPFTVILGVVLVLASGPPPGSMLPCLLASIALLIRWAALRLPDSRDALAANIAWPLVLGTLGVVLILSRGG